MYRFSVQGVHAFNHCYDYDIGSLGEHSNTSRTCNSADPVIACLHGYFDGLTPTPKQGVLPYMSTYIDRPSNEGISAFMIF